jgi:hypothetical protein
MSRLPTLRYAIAVVVILLYSLFMLAQHSSGGGSGGSSGGGGGSHSSGGSSSSGVSSGGHSSGASSGHGSSTHGSATHGSATQATSGRTGSSHSIREANGGTRNGSALPAKKGFFSFLRHPFRKETPKPVSELRVPFCLKGSCLVCPAGRVGCRPTVVSNAGTCSRRDFSNGGPCILQMQFLGDCSGLRMAYERQQQRMQQAETRRQDACAAGDTRECSDLASQSQSEANLYRELQNRYNRCQQRSFMTFPYGGYSFGAYAHGMLLDSIRLDAAYR